MLAKKIDTAWQLLAGVVQLERLVATRICLYHDGRRQEEACEPYPVINSLDIGQVEQLLAEGTWSQADLDPYGIALVTIPEPPAGKRHVPGTLRLVDAAGAPVAEYDVEDIPPPPAPPTRAEKLERMLTDYGLTLADLRAETAAAARA